MVQDYVLAMAAHSPAASRFSGDRLSGNLIPISKATNLPWAVADKFSSAPTTFRIQVSLILLWLGYEDMFLSLYGTLCWS